MRCFIGIDLGSTTTKAVVIDENQNIIGRGITNSRSNYDTAAAIAKQEALLAHIWDRVKRAELSVLSEVTVEELAKRQRALDAQHTLMYHI